MKQKKTSVKICGITEDVALQAAVESGARFIGLVFYSPSPRNIDKRNAALLARAVPAGVRVVGLFVDPDDALLDDVTSHVGLDMIQLHGAETPERVAEIKERYALPVIKAIRVACHDDVEVAKAYEDIADWLLFDARIMGQVGGTGKNFDWALLEDYHAKIPWMLSGGLNAGNVRGALARLQPNAVDVSSGVEDAPGVKNAQKIREFIEAAQKRD